MLQSTDCLQIFTLQPNIAKSLCLSRILWNVFKSFVQIRSGMTEHNLYKTPTLMLEKRVRSNYQTFKSSKKCIPHTGTITRHKLQNFFTTLRKAEKQRELSIYDQHLLCWNGSVAMRAQTGSLSETLLTHANKHRKALEWHTKCWGQRFKQIVSWPTLSHDYVQSAFMSIAPLAHWQRQQSWQADIMTWQSLTWLNSRYPRLPALSNLCTSTVKIWGFVYINLWIHLKMVFSFHTQMLKDA